MLSHLQNPEMEENPFHTVLVFICCKNLDLVQIMEMLPQDLVCLATALVAAAITLGLEIGTVPDVTTDHLLILLGHLRKMLVQETETENETRIIHIEVIESAIVPAYSIDILRNDML